MELMKYKNGNYTVSIDLSDGTKIRTTDDDEFSPDFAESIDLNITNKCVVGCQWCYQGCTKQGEHAPLRGYEWLIDSMHPYTEVAINGNDLDHPDLNWFLERLREKNVIANITVHQSVFEQNYRKIVKWQEQSLVHGVGVSINDPSKALLEMIALVDNAVIHAVCGLVDGDFIQATMNNGLKLLLLGYKERGRGESYVGYNLDRLEFNMAGLSEVLPYLSNSYRAIAFDTLAVKQLHLQSRIPKEQFNRYYAGEDGKFTFFVDLVNGTFAKSSIERDRMSIARLTVDEMFNVIKERL